jgi:exopolyphosphatase/guanosine-5'-triphosphate,3'-diphosphate pyrophosphatase
MRDAAGGDRLVHFVESNLGTSVRVISGPQEAELMFAGAASGLGIVDSPLIAFDVGGGSTELVRGTRAGDGQVCLDYFASFDVGSVRLTERHPLSDPPLAIEMDVLRKGAAEPFASVLLRAHADSIVGTAGTVTTLAAISLGLETYDASRVHGLTLSRGELERIVGNLAALPVGERKKTIGLHPGRADVIVAGGLIVLAILYRLGAAGIRVSDRGLRWGLAEELVDAAAGGGDRSRVPRAGS